MNFYLEQESKKRLSVDGTLRRSLDQRGLDQLKGREGKIAKRDYLIVAFPFVGADDFPVLMSSLQRRYSLAFSQLGHGGRGFIVFRSRPENGGEETPPGGARAPAR